MSKDLLQLLDEKGMPEAAPKFFESAWLGTCQSPFFVAVERPRATIPLAVFRSAEDLKDAFPQARMTAWWRRWTL